MTNRELIEKVARAIMHDENTYRVGGEEYCETVARIAIATILAALQEPTEAMKEAWDLDMRRWISEEIEDPYHPWRVMLAASALCQCSGLPQIGEQSE
jgi:hypothetical protein